MAEKRVSVRLAAVNGQQVRAELTGVGEAGEKGFRRVSKNVEMANARLAAFARRARIAARIAAASVAAAGVAMVRSGLQTIDAQAKMAHSFRTTTESIQVLARAAELSGNSMQTLQTGFRTLTVGLSQFAQDGTGPAAKAIKALHLNATELLRMPLDKRIAVVTDAIRKYGDTTKQAAMFSQLFGYRGFEAFMRLDTKTLRQAAKDVKDFGVGVSDLDASQVERTNDAITRLGLVWRGISNQMTARFAPALQSLADAMASIAQKTGPLGRAFRGLLDNIGRLTAYAGTFASILAGRWVIGMAAAAASTIRLVGALKVLKWAIIRTGFLAAIALAGEAVYQFSRLVKGAGNFGKSLVLLTNVAVGVWTGIGKLLESFVFKFAAMSTNIQAKWVGLLASLEERWVKFLESINDFRLFDRQIFNLNLGRARAELEGLKQTQSELNDKVATWNSKAATGYETAFDGAAKALESLLAAIKKSDPEMDTSISTAKTLAETLKNLPMAPSGGSDGKPSSDSGDASKTLTGWDATMAALKRWMDSAQNWGKNLGDTLVGAFRSAESAIHRFVETGKLDFKGLVRSILADLATLAAHKAFANIFSSLFSAGFTTSDPSWLFGNTLHSGGIAGMSGVTRPMPALAFAAAPRMHNGGWVGLRPDEVPAILQRGERVLSRREAAKSIDGGGVTVSINVDARGAQQGVAEQVAKQLREAEPRLTKQAVDAVRSARARGKI